MEQKFISELVALSLNSSLPKEPTFILPRLSFFGAERESRSAYNISGLLFK